MILNMKLQVEILTGKFFYIEVGDDGKVADLKRVIGAHENLPNDRTYSHSLQKSKQPGHLD